MADGDGDSNQYGGVANSSSATDTAVDKDKKIDRFYPPLLLTKCYLPKYCQGMVFALVLMCLSIIGQGMVVTGQLPITLTMLEKNFGFTSVQTGAIHSFYDVFFGCGALTVGILAKKRKLFFVGVGVFIMSFGSFLFTLPNFLHNYHKFDLNDYALTSNIVEYGTCDVNGTDRPIAKPTSNVVYHVLFCIGYSLIGFGAAPMHTSALAYFDENLTPETNGLYLGIYYLFGAIGPAISFGLGKLFLSLPVTLNYDTTSILTPQSESFIGAWWLGYIVVGIVLAISGVLLVLYPSRISPQSTTTAVKQGENRDDAQKQPRSSNVTINSNDQPKQPNIDDHHTAISIFGKILKSLITLIKNVPYVFMVLGMSVKGITINGLGTFLAKIFEVQFRYSSSTASVLSGVLAITGAGLGILLGGLLMKMKGRTIQNNILIVLIINFLASLMYTAFLFGCDSRDFGKISLDDKFRITDNTTYCQARCHCRLDRYEPVCDESTNITHISPCLAGCHTNYTEDGKLHFKHCDCLSSQESVLVQGGCISPCNNNIYKFMTMALLAMFLSFLVFVPEIAIMLQLLPYESKNWGLAAQQLFTRIGFIVGPILYGYLLDRTCILWSKDVHNNGISYCLEYNNPQMRLNLSISSICIELFSTLLYFVTYLIVRHRPRNIS